jgi:hypothetical protein
MAIARSIRVPETEYVADLVGERLRRIAIHQPVRARTCRPQIDLNRHLPLPCGRAAGLETILQMIVNLDLDIRTAVIDIKIGD